MNGFTKKSVGTLTLGEKLKKLRSERRMSLNEASRVTRIQVKYLEYLEEGKYEKLPANVYVRGFLKNYAEFLGVSEEALFKLYDKESGIKKNLEKQKKENTQGHMERQIPISISSFVVTPKMIAAGSIIILIFLGVFYLYKEVGSFASTPRLVVLSPENNYSTASNSVSVEGVTDRDSKILINDQPVLVNDDGKFRETLTVQSGTNIINIKAINRFEKETAQTLTIQSIYQEVADKPADPNDAEKPEEKTGVDIEVRVDPGPVWLSVETDGNLVFSGTMLTGATQTFHADSKISINSGKANATFVKFNGKDIGKIGDSSGPVRGVTLDTNTKY
jgi:cytoskeleton protein RodZ